MRRSENNAVEKRVGIGRYLHGGNTAESQAFAIPPVDGVGAGREKFSSRHSEKVVRFRGADKKQSGGNKEEQAYL